MFKQLKRGLQLCLVIAILAMSIPSQMALSTQASSVDTHVEAISFKDNIGYYAQGGNVYRYDQESKKSTQVDVPVNDVVSVAYDGTHLYVVNANMSISAYDIANKAISWKNESLSNGKNQLGSAIFLDKGVLYIHAYYINAYKENLTTILQLQTTTGSVVKTTNKTYRDVTDSLPYSSGDRVVYSGKDIAFINGSSETFIQLSGESFITSVYDATSKQLFAIGKDGALYVTEMDESKTYLTLYKTKQSYIGSFTKATVVDDTPLLITIEENQVVLYFFDGVSFVKQNTMLTTSSIHNIVFNDGNMYIVDADNKVQSAKYTVPVEQNMDNQAAQLQSDILNFYDSISQNVKNLTLANKPNVEALYARYQALSTNHQEQILASSVLTELHTKITSLQKNLDTINMEISLLSAPKDFKKEDCEKAIAIESKYKLLKAYDKTLVDQKLLQILDKIKAFHVEEEIASLPAYANITIKDLPRIQEVAQHYDVLVSEWKKDVSNYTLLQRLENRIYELMSGNTLGDAYWSNFGGNKTSTATTNTKTPYVVDDVQSNFTATDGKYQESIIVDDHIYTIRDKTYLTILDNKGNLIAETKLYSKIGFFSRLAYGDGKIYVPLNNCIQAFDAKTLRPLWLSQTGNQFISTITYHDGYIYSGMTTGGGGDKGKTNGYFFALNVKDEDPNNAFEVKDFAWTCGEAKNTGYYWAGAAIVGDAVVFAGDSGEVFSHHLSQAIVYDRYLLGDTKVRANISYIESEKAILVGTQDTQTLFKIKMNEDGSFQKNTIQSVDVKGDITGGVSYYNNRAYVPSGGMYAKGFSVVDVATMQLAYRNNDVGSQSYPLISTAYATSANKQEVKIYILDYSSGDLRVLHDAQGQTTSRMQTLVKGYGTYNSGSITPDAYGNLYICGASFSGGGPLYSIQSKDAKFSITDMENAIANFPMNFSYKDKKAFQLLLNTYLSMSVAEQKQVHNANVLVGYETTMQRLSDEKILYIQGIIDTLPKKITLQNQDAIRFAQKGYGELLESDLLRIRNYELLVQAEQQLQILLNGFEQLQKDIDAIDLEHLTLVQQVNINTLLARYEKLSVQERQYITNYDKLRKAQEILKKLADSLEIPRLNSQVDAVLQIPSPSLNDEKQIFVLYKTMMNIDEDVRIQINGYERFLAVYENMIAQRKQVNDIDDAIWNQIQPLDIQLQDCDAIIALYERYIQLPERNKLFLTNVEDLQYAKEVIDKMKEGYLAKALFEKIKMANTSYTFRTTSDGLLLTFTFAGKDITSPIDFAFQMTSKSLNEGAIYSLAKDAQILSFAHGGAFPGKATIQMETKIADGNYHLYYYNSISKTAELVQDIYVEDGMTSFSLSHASTYFISNKDVDPLQQSQLLPTTNVNTGDTTSILWLWATICSSMIAITRCIRKRKL